MLNLGLDVIQVLLYSKRVMKRSDIHIIEGSVPVLISAPHTRPLLKQEGGRSLIKPREIKITPLLKELCKETGAWGIFIRGKDVIKNWDEEAYKMYKEATRDIILAQNIALFIDTHGCQDHRPFLVDYDFKIPQKKPDDYRALEKILLKQLEARGFAGTVSCGFFRTGDGVGKNTMSFYVRRYLGTPAVQLEINKMVRDNKILFRNCVAALGKTIQEYVDMLLLPQGTKDTYENSTLGVRKKELLIRNQKPY